MIEMWKVTKALDIRVARRKGKAKEQQEQDGKGDTGEDGNADNKNTISEKEEEEEEESKERVTADTKKRKTTMAMMVRAQESGKKAEQQNEGFDVLPSWSPFSCTVHDRGGYRDSPTKQYDDIALQYLSTAFFPLVVGYSIYSLAYKEHKGVYSWVLRSLVGFIYSFGFIMMTPQLFINYKMKSVAHMPWRAMVYKSLNTFVDDLFAFVIKMPLLHRIACFRDDIIFFIYLYQVRFFFFFFFW